MNRQSASYSPYTPQSFWNVPVSFTSLVGRDQEIAALVEALRLLAQGMTDAQIADRLVISVRTVNNHTTSIYNKIGVSTRSAATRYAVERKMV